MWDGLFGSYRGGQILGWGPKGKRHLFIFFRTCGLIRSRVWMGLVASRRAQGEGPKKNKGSNFVKSCPCNMPLEME